MKIRSIKKLFESDLLLSFLRINIVAQKDCRYFTSTVIKLLVFFCAFTAPSISSGFSIVPPPLGARYGHVLARPLGLAENLWYADNTPLAPVPSVKIYYGAGTGGMFSPYTYSRDNGRYAIAWYTPYCPKLVYSYPNIITAELHSTLHPKYPQFIIANSYLPTSTICIGFPNVPLLPTFPSLITYMTIEGLKFAATLNYNIYESEIFIDVMFVLVSVRFKDGDNFFTFADEATYNDATGLPSRINREDAKNTEIYVYNLRTNELIAKRESFTDSDITADSRLEYLVPIVGPNHNSALRAAADTQLSWVMPKAPALPTSGIPLAASRARPGDEVKVIAINRVTGYTGSATRTLETVGQTDASDRLDFAVVPIELEPANIKIKIEREYEITHGATQLEDRNYLVGFEGSALASDNLIKLTTDWSDHDGNIIPDVIPGFTGRVAKIAAANTTNLSEIATFDIRPGVHQQWLYTSDNSPNDHYYLHLCAEDIASDVPCDFSSIRTVEPMIYRPENVVPMKILKKGIRINDGGQVDRVDTDSDGIADDYELIAQTDPLTRMSVPDDNDNDGIPDILWDYRPEAHFSIFDLDITDVNVLRDAVVDPNDSESIYVPYTISTISWFDQEVNILYLLASQYLTGDPIISLPILGDPRQLVFLFGDEKVNAILDQNGEITFTSLNQLQTAMDQASPEDYLSLRLVQQSDPGNVLWEFAFEALAVDMDIDSDNNNGFDFPDRSEVEERLEFIEMQSLEFPGKVVGADRNDDDDDGIPDFADFNSAANFIPFVVEIPNALSDKIATGIFSFSYSSSNPADVIEQSDGSGGTFYIPGNGDARIWKVGGYVDRNIQSVVDGGHYIPSGVELSASMLNLSSSSNSITLYLEAIQPSDFPGQLQISFQFETQDGLVATDRIKSTSTAVEIAVDLDRDNRIEFQSETPHVKNPDETSPSNPFRFWLNNDLDIVSNRGEIEDSPHVSCQFIVNTEERQVCEQDDAYPEDHGTNISVGPYQVGDFDRGVRTGIESERDLEDFVPVAIKLPFTHSSIELSPIKIKITGYGFDIGVFKGYWTNRDSSSHITDIDNVNRQTLLNTFMFDLKDNGQPGTNNTKEIDPLMIDSDGIIRLLVEGHRDNGVCFHSILCYLEVTLEDVEDNVISSQKLYMQFYDVKDYYDHWTLGNYTHGPEIGAGVPEHLIVPHAPAALHEANTPLVFNSEPNSDYVLFVHGWRMPPAERVLFAETTLKRLYWSGYKGKFGFISWPTGWYSKPAWAPLDHAQTLVNMLLDMENYNRSEAIARRTGWLIQDKISNLAATHDLHLIAHSMGNVVVSEALRKYSGPQIDAYVPMQAAEVSASYNQLAPRLEYQVPDIELLPDWMSELIQGQTLIFEGVWELLNSGEMPTDRYAYSILPIDPVTNLEHYTERPLFPGRPGGVDPHRYYKNISSKVDQIINFHNKHDVALLGYIANQLLKPDEGWEILEGMPGGAEWIYTFNQRIDSREGSFCILNSSCNYFFDRYHHNPDGVFNTATEIFYELESLSLRGQPDILSNITPSKYAPLGVSANDIGGSSLTEVVGSVDLSQAPFLFTNSNYDHSAQFLSTFTERQCFWYWMTDYINPTSTIIPNRCF